MGSHAGNALGPLARSRDLIVWRAGMAMFFKDSPRGGTASTLQGRKRRLPPPGEKARWLGPGQWQPPTYREGDGTCFRLCCFYGRGWAVGRWNLRSKWRIKDGARFLTLAPG